VLAGLINREERSNGAKVPGVGELPLLGRLFGSNHDDSEKTEIVLSITPHLIRNVQRPEASASEFSAGTEGSFRRKPDMSTRALTQLPGASAPRPPGMVMMASPASSPALQAAPAPAVVAVPTPVALPPAVQEAPPPQPPAAPPATPAGPNLGSATPSPPPADPVQPSLPPAQ
jgi:general secretion pathway protein D